MMIKAITPFIFDESTGLHSDNNDFILFDTSVIGHLTHPVKLNVTSSIFCLSGTIKGKTNMRYFEAQAPCMIIFMADHTVTVEHISEDFSALFVILSKKFTKGLYIDERLRVFLSLHNKPFIALDKDGLISVKDYFKTVGKVLKQTDNPFGFKIIQHITTAFFYSFGYHHHIQENGNEVNKTRQEDLVESFLTEVRNNFKTERGVGFYAEKLCVTPKYLSKIIKDHNGLSAKEWIEDYVVWEAEALLKSTTMTIQQISDELNFPSQSFFGKYFKRSVGLSPLEYRKR